MNERLLIPCMQGTIGNWITYTCLMTLNDICSLISFADDIHKNKRLSQLIQRELKRDRQKEIGEYLLNDDESFFSGLVVAVYEGDPQWHKFEKVTKNNPNLNDIDIPDYAKDCMGFLSLSRNEKIFALDGQHRLAGIQYALSKEESLGFKQLPVTFLPHYNDPVGLKRTRRLFTTLNKKAKPVDKAAIISLDEDDICACATRQLVEESEYFNGQQIKYQANNNVAYSDDEVLTTIGNLYDLIKIMLRNIKGISTKNLDNYRGSDAEREDLFLFVEDVFSYMFNTVTVLVEYYQSNNRQSVVNRYRNRNDGGNFLFRPVGLKIYLLAMSKYIKDSDDNLEVSYRDFIDSTSTFNFMMNSSLLADRVWDVQSKKMIPFKAEIRDQIISEILKYVNKLD